MVRRQKSTIYEQFLAENQNKSNISEEQILQKNTAPIYAQDSH